MRRDGATVPLTSGGGQEDRSWTSLDRDTERRNPHSRQETGFPPQRCRAQIYIRKNTTI